MTSPHRLDLSAFVAALDRRRVGQGLTWRQVASQSGVSPSTLSRVQNGKQPDVNTFAALIRWLEVPADQFLGFPELVRAPSDPFSPLSALLGGEPATAKEAAALADLVQAAARLMKLVNERQADRSIAPR